MILGAVDQTSAEIEARKFLTHLRQVERGWSDTVWRRGRFQRAGFVYVIEAGDRRIFKIGKSKKTTRRLDSMQVGCPDELRLHTELEVPDMMSAERTIHRMLAEYRVRGEWFAPPEDELQAAIEAARNLPPPPFSRLDPDCSPIYVADLGISEYPPGNSPADLQAMHMQNLRRRGELPAEEGQPNG